MDRLKKVMKKDPFYVVLFVCICIVAISGVWVSKNNLDIAKKFNQESDIKEEIELNLEKAPTEKKVDTEKEQAQKEETKQEDAKQKVDEVEQPNQAQNKVGQNNIQSQAQAQAQTQTASSDITEQSAITMSNPVKGNITIDFAKDKLVYSKTLEQWTTHNGIDIQANEGTAVLAAMDGTIKEIKKDDALGIVITIDHGNGLETKYGNLATDDMVKKGQSIKKGSTISKVGKGAGFSKLEDPHVHFEVVKNGKNLDPKQFIK